MPELDPVGLPNERPVQERGTTEAAIEALILHDWQSEWRAGVEHYAVGQHFAIAVTTHPESPEPWEPDALLAFVPSSGHGVTIVPCLRAENIWCPLGTCWRILCALKGERPLPYRFTLSEAMESALREAVPDV